MWPLCVRGTAPIEEYPYLNSPPGGEGASIKEQAMHIHASRASHLALATHFSIHFIVGALNTSFLLFVG